MSDTPDWAEREAERLLPCQNRNIVPNSCEQVAGLRGLVGSDDEHLPVCAASLRDAVAAALRTVAAREYARGLEDAARVADSRFAADGWETTAAKIRAFAVGEQT